MSICKSKLQNPKFPLNNKSQTFPNEDSGSFNINIASSNVFRKQRIFIDDISNVEYHKLKCLLQELKAEVLDTFDESVNYVIVANNKLKAPLNDTLNNSKNSKISNLGSKTILKSRQVKKALSSNVNNEPVLTNSEGWNFILHLQKLKIPALSFMEVFKWINMYHSNLIQEIEVKNQNKVLDKNKMLKLISKPGLKILDIQAIYASDYMSNCNFEHIYFQETSLNELNEKSDIETCESKIVSDFSKRCQRSSKLLKPIVGNVKKKKVKSDEKYCECCDVKYKNVIAHIESAQHMEFAKDTSKFSSIDNIIKSYSDFDAFFTIRKRKQKALERIESRKLIKQLSANDFKNEFFKPPEVVKNSELNEPSINKTALNLDIDEKSILVEFLFKIFLRSANDFKNEFFKPPEVVKNSELNEPSINKTALNLDIDVKSLRAETPEKISEQKLDTIIEQVIMEPIKSNINNSEIKFSEVVDSNNDSKIPFNESKENLLPSIFIEKLEISKENNHPESDLNIDSLVVNEKSVTENLTTVNKKRKSVNKKKSKKSLKLRKPCFAKSIENITESCDILDSYKTYNATISEYKLEYHTVEVSNNYFHAAVFNCVSEISTTNAQEILPVCEYQACCTDISYDIVTYDKKFTVNHMLFAPVDILTEILGQCGKMTFPDFISLNPINVSTLLNVASTMVVNPLNFSSSDDISIIEKIPICRANPHVLNNINFELVTASVQIITAVNNVEIEIVNVLDNSLLQNSDEESSLIIESATLNDSFGSSIEMLSSCHYNVKLDTTSDSVHTPLSPITSDYKHHAFSPFILRSANKSSVDNGFSPEFSISPPRYVSDNKFELDFTPISNEKMKKPNLLSSENGSHRNSKSRNKHSTNSNKDDLILNLKQIVNQKDIAEITFFDRLSESKLTNSKQKLLFSVDSFVENHFLKQFDLNLSSDRKCLQEVTNQKPDDVDLKSKKRIRPETGFSSPEEYYRPLIGNLTKKQRRIMESRSSEKYIFESPVQRRPFRRAKYIARESISISTQLYLN